MKVLLLDTNTIIDFFNSKLSFGARKLIESSLPAISVITRIELFASSKMQEKERLALDEFVSFATVYDHINKEIITKTISIRKNHNTKLPDDIIAATGIVNGLTLVTRNNKDFNDIKELRIIDPYTL